jgi:hypothetical protein
MSEFVSFVDIYPSSCIFCLQKNYRKLTRHILPLLSAGLTTSTQWCQLGANTPYGAITPMLLFGGLRTRSAQHVHLTTSAA